MKLRKPAEFKLPTSSEEEHMAREKKDAKNLNIKLDRALAERFEAYCMELGQTKTTAIERILRKHLDEFEGGQQIDKAQRDA